MATAVGTDIKEGEVINPDYINLKVKSQEGEEIYFKIKKTTGFKKLMDTYCQRANVIFHSIQLAITNVRFLFDGQRITETQTPKDVFQYSFS
jgi:small ubiquitin-related modifier